MFDVDDSSEVTPGVPDPADVRSLAAEILERRCEDVLSDFESRLRTTGSPLLAASGTGGQLAEQVRAIIDTAARALRGQGGGGWPVEDSLSREIGSSRAGRGVHPSESLMASAELSESALLIISQEMPPDVPFEAVATVASTVQRSIMQRVAMASVSYVDYLLENIHESHVNERRRISRELHDRVANSLAFVYQGLNLYARTKNKEQAQADERLGLLRETVRETLDSARALSAELRSSAIREGLEVALSDLIPAIVPEGVEALVSAKGNEDSVPPHVKDELFLALREALRNAVSHSSARHIRLGLDVGDEMVRVSVRDDGRGFDPDGAEFVAGTGLQSMRERAHLLGGRLNLETELGAGTKVEIEVPLVRS